MFKKKTISQSNYRANFKLMRIREEFSVDNDAIGVCNKLYKERKGLVEK